MEKYAQAELDRPEQKRVVAPAHGVLCMIARIRAQDAEIERLREALISIRGWREIGSAVTTGERLLAIEDICDAALSPTLENDYEQ